MAEEARTYGSPLRISLWNLVYRIASATDHSKTVWIAVLRGACLAFFKEPVDDLPSSDNDAAREAFRERFFAMPEHRIYDLFEFLLADDRAGLKEVDRKLIRRSINGMLEEECAPVRLLRDRFVPLPDSLGLDAVASAGEKMTMFDMAAGARHLASALEFLSKRPFPAARDAIREALLAVAAVVRTLSGEGGAVAVGTIGPAASRFDMPPDLLAGIESILGRCHRLSGLPGVPSSDEDVSLAEASFLVVFCSSVVNYLVSSRQKSSP